MRRARGPTYQNHFTTEKILRWRCNICKRRKRRPMTRKQAKVHGGSAKHCSKAETATFFKNPRNFTAVEIWKWRCIICHGRGRAMTRGKARIHEAKKKHYSRVATVLFNHPGSFKYSGNGKWRCHICKGAAMTVEGARAHEILCQRPNSESDLQVASSAGRNSVAYLGLLSSLWWTSTRNVASSRASERLEVAESDSEAESLDRSLDDQSEGNGNVTSIHQEGKAFERDDSDDSDDSCDSCDDSDDSCDDSDNEDEDNGDGDDDNADNDNAENDNTDNDNADDNDDNADNKFNNNADNNNDNAGDEDDNDDAAFVENFLRCHDVDAGRRKRLRSFYKMPADQKIQKIQEMLHGQ